MHSTRTGVRHPWERDTDPVVQGPAARYLLFGVAGLRFALPSGAVQAIRPLEASPQAPPASAPPSPAAPVVDLGVRLGSGPIAATFRACLVEVRLRAAGAPPVVALAAEGPCALVDVGPGDVEPPSSLGALRRLDVLAGVTRDDEGELLLLDLERLVTEPAESVRRQAEVIRSLRAAARHAEESPLASA
jgi:purine-binding chemotaxis protein CheW